jgi:transposase
MAQTVSIIVTPEDRSRLAAVIGDRNSPLKHVQRARIVLLSFERLSVLDIAGRIGVSRPAVWRWQVRYAEQGVDGLLKDKTRKSGKPPVPLETVARVLALPCSNPPGNATHWTGRAVAKAIGVSLRTVQRIWDAHRLQPHRLRTFKKSNDPAFAEKVEDVVGLYMEPPCHAVVLSIDEKSQIQALDRTQPGLPLKPGKCATLTHDYKRNGTTTLFAALNVLDGTVLGRCMKRHTHQEFIKFLNAVERAVPAGKVVHAILDNYATHKPPKVKAWLADHPRWVFHFTPTSASWLNAVEGFFSVITRRRIRRGVFRSVTELEDAIRRYIRDHNTKAKPFVWTKTPKDIFDKLARLPVPSE